MYQKTGPPNNQKTAPPQQPSQIWDFSSFLQYLIDFLLWTVVNEYNKQIYATKPARNGAKPEISNLGWLFGGADFLVVGGAGFSSCRFQILEPGVGKISSQCAKMMFLSPLSITHHKQIKIMLTKTSLNPNPIVNALSTILLLQARNSLLSTSIL